MKFTNELLRELKPTVKLSPLIRKAGLECGMVRMRMKHGPEIDEDQSKALVKAFRPLYHESEVRELVEALELYLKAYSGAQLNAAYDQAKQALSNLKGGEE
jgi:hypothetical protein